jgi:hypothetical protein
MEGLGILGAASGLIGSRKMSGVEGKVAKTLVKVDLFLLMFEIFLLIITVIVLFLFCLKLYQFYCNYKFKKVRLLLHQIYTDIVINLDSMNLDSMKQKKENENKLKVSLSKEETIGELLKVVCKRKFFKRKLGKATYEMVVDSLMWLEKNRKDGQSSLLLVNNLIRTFEV